MRVLVHDERMQPVLHEVKSAVPDGERIRLETMDGCVIIADLMSYDRVRSIMLKLLEDGYADLRGNVF